jgi:hypothetical protein
MTFAVKSNLELLILELLPFGGFFSHFDLADLNQHPRAGDSRRNFIPPVDSSSMNL